LTRLYVYSQEVHVHTLRNNCQTGTTCIRIHIFRPCGRICCRTYATRGQPRGVIFSSGCEGLKRLFSRLFVSIFIGARQVRTEPEGHSCRTISYSSIMKSYCLRDISPSRTHNRRDRSPGCQLCYVTEQYVPRIGYLKERVRT
jgi:hypothetical protein